MDLSEELKRLYRYLDSIDRLAADKGSPIDHENLAFIAGQARAYVDSIASQVDYEQEDEEEDEE